MGEERTADWQQAVGAAGAAGAADGTGAAGKIIAAAAEGSVGNAEAMDAAGNEGVTGEKERTDATRTSVGEPRTWEDTHTIPGALTKADIYALLDARGIEYEAVEHPPVFTVEEAQARAKLPFAEHEAKNLFLRDPKHRNYYLVTVPENKTVDLKALQERLGSKRLSFASPADLAEKIGIYPGSVSPFCALNDETRTVQVALDADFERWGQIGCHPCSNTASVHVRTADLEAILREHGSPFKYIEV